MENLLLDPDTHDTHQADTAQEQDDADQHRPWHR